MSLLPVAVWGLQVSTEDGIVPAISDIPATFRITMAALDPTAKPKDEDKPLRATLKLIRRPLQSSGFDDEDSESSEDGESEDEGQAKDLKSKKGSKKDTKEGKAVAGAKMDTEEKKENDEDDEDDEDGEDNDDEDEDEDEEGEGEEDKHEIEEFTICTLDSDRHYQQPLDITVGEDEECYFKVIGNYDISLTGNYVMGSNDRGFGDYDESESDEDYDLSPSEDELNMYGGESESDDLDDLDDPRIQEIVTDEETETKPAEKKINKKTEKKSLKRTAEESEGEDLTLDDLIAKSKEVIEAAATPEKKLSKKQLKRLKANDGKAVDTTAEAKAKKVQFAKELEQGPTPSPVADKKIKKKPEAKKPETKKSEAKKSESSGKSSRVVQGITIMDSKIGTGPAAKRGNKLSMRYIGKLENGKVFDSNTKGKPFTFSLGRDEVIKGWDIGLEGMQVGGERRLKIPPASAYGKKTFPDIPANSTLIFDVKLMDIK